MRVHALKRHLPAHAPGQRERRMLAVRDFRARGKLALVIVDKDSCVACDGTIDRFDREAFRIARRCCACEAELAGG